jgi:STE24 endopeptidase
MRKIHPLLEPEKQVKARRYEREKRLFGLAGLLVSLGILLAFYFSGASAALAGLFPGGSMVWVFLVYVAALLSGATLLGLPLDYLSGYVHEQRWGFSNQTVRGWLWDKLKSFLVSLVLAFIVLGLLLWVMSFFREVWWLAAGLGMALVGTVFATLFPVLILPLFNKYTPIEDQALIRALSDILARGGLKSSGFFKQDMSRQTKKENAFLAGLGKTRRVVLADNLMAHMSIPEIVSVIAHEVGHYRHRHIWKNVLIGTGQQVVVFFCIHLIMRAAYPGFLSSTRWNLAHLPVFFILMGGLSGFIFGPLNMALSRRFERQADRYALDHIPTGRDFETALAGLANRNLANAYPEWWMKILFYSHPPIGERLAMAEAAVAAESPPGEPVARR